MDKVILYHFLAKSGTRNITWHVPGRRREVDGEHWHAVGRAVALEGLREEAAEKHVQPFGDHGRAVRAAERLLRRLEDLRATGLLGDANLNEGSVYTLATAAEITGTFQNMNVPKRWRVSVHPTKVTLAYSNGTVLILR